MDKITMKQPPLKPLHSDDALNRIKIDKFNKLSDKELIDSLQLGQDGSLKARLDGTVLDGHHRLKMLRERGVDIDALPREIIEKDSSTT
jgi:ParB-like chromosome segregation protein Spo0J